jgi:hypothetical protein
MEMGSGLRDISTAWEYTQYSIQQSLVENYLRETGRKHVKTCARFGSEKWEVGCAPPRRRGHILKGFSIRNLWQTSRAK